MAKKVEVQSERLYLEPLSIVAHLDDFHELWATEEAVKWSYVFLHAPNFHLYSVQYYSKKPRFT
jgi:hypothetical protein